MTNQFSKRTVIGVILMIFSLMANAQTFIEIADTDKEYVLIKTGNKKSYVGYIADEMKDSYTLQTDEGNIIFVEKSTIKTQLNINKENIVNGEYWAPNPSTNIITSNAFGLKKGEGYYQNNMIIVNSAGYGITDEISVSAGFESTSILISRKLPVFFVNGKYSKALGENFTIGGNASIIKAPNSFGEGIGDTTFGVVSGLATYGNRNRNITAGLRYAFGKNGSSRPIFSLGGQFRLTKRLALLGDLVVVTNEDSILYNNTEEFSMLGLRFLGDNVIVDGSLLILTEIGIGIPTMAVRIPFGNRS